MWQSTRRQWLGSAIGLAGSALMTDANAETLALYQLIKPRPAKQAAARWAKQFAGYGLDQVVGYSALAHLFMRNSKTGGHALIYPYEANGKNYGVFKATADFEQKILKDDYVEDVIFLRKHVEAIRKLKGPLGPEQVYIPTLYAVFGGHGKPETYDKGDVWVHLDIVAQWRGF